MVLKVNISARGAILLGNLVACDAFDETHPLRVVTHAHADHLVGLKRSLKTCNKVLMTEATKELIEVLKGPQTFNSGFIEKLEYGKSLVYKGEKITLLKANHILGAAQVLVENNNGDRVAYTGDFKLDGTPPIKDCDTLVVEATYGNPSFRRSFDSDIRELLVSIIEKRLRKGKVYVFGYYGKLQEIMQILRCAHVYVPFVMPERILRVSEVCKRHGMNLGDLTLSSDVEGKELLDKNLPCIAFYHMNKRKSIGLSSSRICVSGWEFRLPCKQIGQNEHLVALSDHSDFDELVEYIRLSKPKKVVTDNYRVKHGNILAREIKKRLGIQSVAMPKRKCKQLLDFFETKQT
ncbi:MAG: MBL fold metallo-hydrolase [Candidatus Bathyarchaeota archaeon]|nr:MBL fold metallo-hydrolase [Candidatus Bathyarchaeota archaeon]